MKIFYLITCTVLLLISSCSTYQVSMLNSPDMKKDERTGVFTMENDSVRITYSFSGANSPIDINIYNKTETPMYIDWRRSALIVDSNVISYASNQVKINGSITSSTLHDRSVVRLSESSLSATANLPENVTFLPPRAKINASPVEVAQWVVPVVPDQQMRAEKLPYLGSDPVVKVKVADFTAESSPAKFRSYLTLYTIDGSNTKLIAYQNHFFVSKLIKTDVAPEYLNSVAGQRADYILTNQKRAYKATSVVSFPDQQ